ncbi:long-chain-fatty-acid--CoA ligase, putative [Entamoeba invadens IP1]|uniref:Long-chain-fatty-acid--CoA ligase, putative n=1 Tax=Entamoeba invadens IP1 TaxID=370355 RepID=A0A0A1U9Z9_ENTIV|nr:long-chain-fatty-acid--CoA ligase, putative [Entamoeba invadens IP1]ELP91883.1 long-chain-fatty-acid--CoA ligase, putative [Entamoeba invadens IP1]|eukprot:XP_004258654.1 long-chain-fatty-acid--CoA ligase, putative [Entamoeba invadens IP1]
MFALTVGVVILVTLVILYYLRPSTYPKKLNGQWVGEAKPGETRILRGYTAEKELVTENLSHFRTINDVVNGFTREDKKEFVGYRRCESTVAFKTMTVMVNGKEEQKKLYKYKMSPYIWISSVEYHHMINRLSTGLLSIGLMKGDKLGIFCETRYEWMALLLAACRQGIIAVTVYATLSDDAVKIALEETDIKGLVVSEDTAKRLPKIGIKQHVIVINVDENKENKTSFEALNLSEEKTEFAEVHENDLAMIMYTSGTSNSPKGVTVNQNQILMLSYAYTHVLEFSRERFIAYLPLAHIFEIGIEFALLMDFATIGYAGTRTLTAGGCHECNSDLIELNPTAMIGVPTVFNRVKKGILETVGKSNWFKRFMFSTGFYIKKALYVDYNLCPPYLFTPLLKVVDGIIFKPLSKSLLGKNIKSVIVGGSALHQELQHFLTVILPNVAIMQGFGMTELCGAALAMPHNDPETSTIGVIFPTYEAKLRDVAELGYLTSDNPPRGELMFKGLPVTKGYFKRDEENKESFTEDGWFCTGDIATIKDDLHVCIIDRKKNIVKQPCGEYISLEPIESKYSSSKVIDNICVFADPFHDFIVALISPSHNVIKEINPTLAFNDAIKNKDVIESVKKMLAEVEVGLSAKQKIKYFTLVPEEWTPENGLLTAALKLKRPAINLKYLPQIQQMFSLN